MEGKEYKLKAILNEDINKSSHLYIQDPKGRMLAVNSEDFKLEELQEIADKLNSYEKLKKDSDFEINRLFEWLMNENREPANTKFTAGPTRNLAMEIEYRFSELKKVRDELRELLERLLNLKEYKDKNGKDGNYLKSQPIVREDAKSLLNKLQ